MSKAIVWSFLAIGIFIVLSLGIIIYDDYYNSVNVVNTTSEEIVADVVSTNYTPSSSITTYINNMPMTTTQPEEYDTKLSYNKSEYLVSDSNSYAISKGAKEVRCTFVSKQYKDGTIKTSIAGVLSKED